MTSISVKTSQKSKLLALANEKNVPVHVIVDALLSLVESPYNRALFDHLIRLYSKAHEFDTAKDTKQRIEAKKELMSLAKESEKFLKENP